MELHNKKNPTNPTTTRPPTHSSGITSSSHQVPHSLIYLVLTVTGAFCSGMGVGFCNIDKLQL